jgi:hypothetical protein
VGNSKEMRVPSLLVIPAEAGIQLFVTLLLHGNPAFASARHSGEGRNPVLHHTPKELDPGFRRDGDIFLCVLDSDPASSRRMA